MLYPSAFRSLVRQTRKALENGTLLAGHSYCGDFGGGVGGGDSGMWGDNGVMEQRISHCGNEFLCTYYSITP